MPVVLLDQSHSPLLPHFQCGNDELDAFLNERAIRCGEARCIQTYLWFDEGNQIIGYATVLADYVQLQQRKLKKLGLHSDDHSLIPALKLARMGVSKDRQGSGVGTELLRTCLSIALGTSEKLGLRLITVDAYPESVSYYERCGFIHNQSEEKRHEKPSMRLDIRAESIPFMDE